MAEIRYFGPLRRLRSDAAVHIQRYSGGRRVQSGRGLAFWFFPDRASIAEIPMDDRDLPFLFHSRSRDFQEITVQGVIVWRVANPEALADRIDFSIDLKTGVPLGQPLDQIAALLTNTAQQYAAQYLAERDVEAILAAGVSPLQQVVEAGLAGSQRIAGMGLEVVSARVADISPSSELKRALQTPTFERVQQQADQATFERRALAVQKERAIAENELQNQIELARRQKELIENEAANTRDRARAEAEAKKIAAEGEADRIRTVEGAKAETERTRVGIYGAVPPGVLLSLAAQEFAGKLNKIEHLNITPDLLSALLADKLGREPATSPAAPPPGAPTPAPRTRRQG